MPRRKGRQPSPPSTWLNHKRKLMLALGLLISLLASGILAQRAHLWPTLKLTATPAPTGLETNSPAKEYIYAGSRLVATEEPASQGGGCTYGLSSMSQNFVASGGTSSVNVIVAPGCPWTAVSNAPFVTINSGSTGNGNGTVGYTVTVNTGTARNGTMTIAGLTFTVTQNAGTSCSYSLLPTSQNFGSGGGTSSFNVTAGAGCGWTATSTVNWVTITSGNPGNGSGVVGYSVTANTGAARSGSITVDQQTYTVTQDAATACSYSIFPTSAAYGSSGGPGSFNVTTAAGCGWTATSNAVWITITAGSGTGSGTVSYTVVANPGTARNSSISVGGQTFTITQSASGAPPAPTNLTATALTSTSIRLDWSFVEDGVSIFYIERKTGTTGTYAQIATWNNGARTFTNSKIATHTTYCYRIRAYNGQYSPYSNEACATTP